MPQTVQVGAHETWFEPDAGLIGVRFRGVLSGAEFAEISAITTRWRTEAGIAPPVLALIDNRKSEGLTSDGRRAIANRSEGVGECYCAVFGAGFALRVVLNLVFRAAELASTKFVLRYAADEADARRWLAERKRTHVSRKR
jgi:hypothetical protein